MERFVTCLRPYTHPQAIAVLLLSINCSLINNFFEQVEVSISFGVPTHTILGDKVRKGPCSL